MKRIAGFLFLVLVAPSFGDVKVFLRDTVEATLPISFAKVECYEEHGKRVRIFLGRGETIRERLEVVIPYDDAKEFSKSDSSEVCLKVYDARTDERTFCTAKRDEKASCKVQAKHLDQDRVQVSLDCQDLPRTIVSASRLSFQIPESDPITCSLTRTFQP